MNDNNRPSTNRQIARPDQSPAERPSPADTPVTATPTPLPRAAAEGTTTATGLLIMDVDSTLIDEEVIDVLAELAGVGQQVAQLTAAAMRGQTDFHQALAARVSLLKGLPISVFEAVYQRIHFTQGALELIDRLHQRGWRVAVVSGGFHEVVDKLVAHAGIDFSLANRLESADGRLTGRTVGQIVDKQVKLATLRAWAEELGLSMAEVVAMGDGANDIPMLQTAGLGIAFCAKPVVRQAAAVRLDQRNLLDALPLIEDYWARRAD